MLQSKELDVTYQLNNNKDVFDHGTLQIIMARGIMLFFQSSKKNFYDWNFIPGTLFVKNETGKTHQTKPCQVNFIPKGKFSNHGLMLKFSHLRNESQVDAFPSINLETCDMTFRIHVKTPPSSLKICSFRRN